MLQDIIKYIPQARSITHLSSLLNTPRSTLRDYLIKNNLPTDTIQALSIALQPQQQTQASQELCTVDKLIQIANLKQSMSKVHQQYEFNIERPDEPVVFILWGDQHIGSISTNHSALKVEVETLKELRNEDPSIILALNGDLIDGYFPGSKHSTNEQSLTIDEQRQFAKWVLSELKPEIAISADHEAWSIDSNLNIDFTKDWCEQNNINYAMWQAKLRVNFDNGLTRTILVHHRFPGKTRTNPVGHLMALHRERGPADIVCCSHYHSNAGAYKLQPVRQNETEYWGLQGGTNKINDTYGMKIHDYIADYAIPAVVMLPNGDMYGFDHYTQAIDFKTKLLK